MSYVFACAHFTAELVFHLFPYACHQHLPIIEELVNFFLSFILFTYSFRAQKRDAWRQARMKSLEQDAIQAQLMIQNINDIADDMSESTTSKSEVNFQMPFMHA